MLGLLFRLLGNFIIWTCLASLVITLLSVAGLLRLLPTFLGFLRVLIRAFLILSFRLYYLVMALLSPFFAKSFGVDLSKGLGRVLACPTLSLTLGLVAFFLADIPITWLSVGLFILHGLVVSLAWDEILKPGGLQLGERIQ